MGKRLYCGNLPFSATADEVRAMFAEGGRTVTDVHLVTDRETGRSRGFAFVELGTDDEASDAIQAMNGRMWGGRALAVKEAQERAPRPGFGGPRGPGAPRFEGRSGGGPGGFRPGGPAVERRASFGGSDRGHGGGRELRGPGRDFGGGRGGYAPPVEIPDLAFEPAPAPAAPADYAPLDDVDYRDRGDRGKRGRDRRGGRRRGGDDFGDGGW